MAKIRTATRRAKHAARELLARADASYEPDVQRVFAALVPRGGVCVDVGANTGTMTLSLAQRVGRGGRVFAFEAHPANVARLKRRVLRYRLTRRVVVSGSAISDGSASRVVLYGGRDGSPAEWNLLGHDLTGKPTGSALEVPATALDDAFPSPAHIDLIKIDVEGAEGLVLAGMRRLLAEARPALVIEFHQEEAWASREILIEAGYVLYDVTGARLSPDAARVYHCAALPAESVTLSAAAESGFTRPLS